MKAVRARRLGGREHVKHWLADDGWTVCGRQVGRLETPELLDLETLGSEACDVCLELADRPSLKPPPHPVGVFLKPSYGKLFKDGPVQNTSKQRPGGQRLQGGDW